MNHPDSLDQCHKLIDELFSQISRDEINKFALRKMSDQIIIDLNYWKNKYKELCDNNTEKGIITKNYELSMQANKLINDLNVISYEYQKSISSVLNDMIIQKNKNL